MDQIYVSLCAFILLYFSSSIIFSSSKQADFLVQNFYNRPTLQGENKQTNKQTVFMEDKQTVSMETAVKSLFNAIIPLTFFLNLRKLLRDSVQHS